LDARGPQRAVLPKRVRGRAVCSSKGVRDREAERKPQSRLENKREGKTTQKAWSFKSLKPHKKGEK